MPITDPTAYRDRTEDWSGYFHQQRQIAIRAMITPDLIAEHERNPRGNGVSHSRDLDEVLRYIRNIPSAGKIFIYAVKPFKEYCLARMAGRGQKTELVGNETFSNEDDAAHAVFVARLRELALWMPTQEDIAS